MAGILTQIRIELDGGRVLFTTTDIDAMKAQDIRRDDGQEIDTFSTGDNITIGGHRYNVQRIAVLFQDQTYENNGQYGVGLTTVGDRFPYNTVIIYYVTRL